MFKYEILIYIYSIMKISIKSLTKILYLDIIFLVIKKEVYMSTKEKIVSFIKKEIVLSVAIVFAIATCFFVPIDKRIYRIF